jgi:hypothetical protein
MMSTETVYYSNAKEIKAAELRRREAEARKARRLAVQLKAEKEVQEAARRRIAAANKAIREQEQLFQHEVARLDEASLRLPDLSMCTPVLSTLEVANNNAPEAFEAHVSTITGEVGRFTHQLNVAITKAEHLLQRRLAKAEAWREAKDLEDIAQHRRKNVDSLATQLQLDLEEITLPARPDSHSEVEEVHAYIDTIKQSITEIEQQHARLIACQQSRKHASSLAGPQLHASDAEKAHKEHQASLLASARICMRDTVDQTLNSYGVRMEELSKTTQWLIEDAIASANASDKSEQVIRWIARAKQHLDGARKSLSMMQQIPEMIHEDEHLSNRWSRLVERLQRVANGLDEFTPELDREYTQISIDANRNVCTAYTKADWVYAMSKQGFEVFERKNGEGLVVVDLDNLEVWLEADEIESKEGEGFGVVMELKTDATSNPEQETAITENVCSRLKQVKGATAANNTNVQSEVIARSRKITRGKRPAKSLKTFQQPL